ncbi:uncharacterized protein M421DRAFT_91522 [Didymella exigua CBS 183.55]|uniref:Uncharacterized protein n=1 Tax=Didymella exigua CBS 183.55 TaxID=1150837 RepID=A0A6A5RMQ9_9PLEO|nr:uncharacterized protein M421DRAFT_91522 [Didymella exigua CBS 183.55]KAF1929701.1 hypothetical protein M421DRAFT_91522 [Didymella exigua CBS 183.55]
MFPGDRSRRHRDRGSYSGYPPYGYYEDSDAYESIERYSYATRKSKRYICAKPCPVCNGDFREPFEALRYYNPFEGDMDFVHKCIIATEAGRFIAKDAADRIEEVSKMVNRAYGHNPIFKQWSRCESRGNTKTSLPSTTRTISHVHYSTLNEGDQHNVGKYEESLEDSGSGMRFIPSLSGAANDW